VVWKIAVIAIGSARIVWSIVIFVGTAIRAVGPVSAIGAVIMAVIVMDPCGRRHGDAEGRNGRGSE
jgi:hypothetical protein